MAQIIIAEIDAYDPAIAGVRTLRYGTQAYVTGGRNLLAWSEDFSNADWLKAQTTLTSGQASPIGDSTAFVLTENDVAAIGYLQRTGITYTAGSVMCWSIFVKRDSIGRATRFPAVRLSFDSAGAGGRAELYFDTATGESQLATLNGTSTITVHSHGVESRGDWWRVHIAASASAASTANQTLFPALGAGASWTGGASATGSVTAWGAQYEPGLLGNYTKTQGAAISDFLFYDNRIQQPANIRRECFRDGRTFGATQIGYGELVLVNNDGALDDLLNYSFAGRRITITLGTMLPYMPAPAWTTILSGTMEQVDLSWSKVTVRVRDKQLDIAKPLQDVRYAGTGGLEGGDDLTGKPKPLVYGQVFNIAPPQTDTSRLIFQLHSGGQVVTVNAAYDRGALLTAGAAYASHADMEANAPAAGQYRVWNDATAGCFIRLGSAPTGTVTADVTQGATRTVGQLFNAILLKAGVPSTNISSADVTALDAAVNYQVGVYAGYNQDRSAIDMLDELCASVGAWYGADASGMFRIGRIVLPTGTEAGTITKTDIIKIERIASRDPGVGVPAWRVKVAYEKIHTVQVDLGSTVPAGRKQFTASEYRRAQASDVNVKTANLLSPELEFKTVLVNKSNAGSEAERLLDIYKQRRDVYQVTIRVDANLASVLDLGKIVKLEINRFGMSAGKKFLIIGITTNMRGYLYELTLWG
ncbi:MAG: hypothetical protein RL758_63 [Pseudomonadota bacterium]|jgi:hypothetical protein